MQHSTSLSVLRANVRSLVNRVFTFPRRIVVAAAVWAFAIAYWFLPKVGGKTFFRGPQTHNVSFVKYDIEIEEVARTGEGEAVSADDDSSDLKRDL